MLKIFNAGYIIDEHLTYDRIIIDVELITDNGCQRYIVLEGTRRDEDSDPVEAKNKTTSKTMFNLSTCLL